MNAASRRVLSFQLAAGFALVLTACSLDRLTGTKPAAKAMCYYDAVDHGQIFRTYVTPAGDTVVLGVLDDSGHVVGILTTHVQIQIPAGLYPCPRS